MRWSRSASSVVIAAAGILGASDVYCSAPVCGVRNPGGPMARTKRQQREEPSIPATARPAYDAIVGLTDAFCREHLARFKTPRQWFFVE